jgi:hypothetical protein
MDPFALSDIKTPSRVVTTTQASVLDIRNRARERRLRGEELALLLAMGIEVRETAPLFVAA